MIVSGIGHVCSHVIACFLLKFPCQTLSLFSLSLASYSACQRRPITVPLVWLVSIMGPHAGSPCRQASGSCALWSLGCQESVTGIQGCELQLCPDQLQFLVAGPNIGTLDKGDLTRAWPASWLWMRLDSEYVLHPHPKYFRGNVTLCFWFVCT